MVRTMRRDEVDWAVELARREGWNPGLGDAEAFFAADPEGFLVAEQDGKPIGCISAVRYPEAFGFMGFYIVLPEHRHQGHGHELWDVAWERMKGNNAGGDGVVEMVPKYLSVGFNYAYPNLRYSGQPAVATHAIEDIVPIEHIPFDQVAAYDRQCFPAPREAFLKAWFASEHSTTLAKLHDGQVTGFGTIRKCFEGYKIGPLFADDATIAEELFLSLCAGIEEGPVFLDTPEPNKAAVALAEKYGMIRVFETARIYTGETPAIELDKVFGVTSFELG